MRLRRNAGVRNPRFRRTLRDLGQLVCPNAFDERNMSPRKGTAGRAAQRLCGAEERRAAVGARCKRALPLLTRRICLSAVSAANVASYAARPQTEHRRGVGPQGRPPQSERRTLPGRDFARSVVADGRPTLDPPRRDNIRPMADPTPDDIQRFIAANLACEHVEVEGDGRHFYATIVSAEFEGSNRIARHQRVYRALGDRMREQIHALSMKTLTPAEYASSRHPA